MDAQEMQHSLLKVSMTDATEATKQDTVALKRQREQQEGEAKKIKELTTNLLNLTVHIPLLKVVSNFSDEHSA